MTDMQQRMKQEEERLAKLDPWKVIFPFLLVPSLPLFFVCFFSSNNVDHLKVGMVVLFIFFRFPQLHDLIIFIHLFRSI